jgi:hypothetical protein
VDGDNNRDGDNKRDGDNRNSDLEYVIETLRGLEKQMASLKDELRKVSGSVSKVRWDMNRVGLSVMFMRGKLEPPSKPAKPFQE